jgi:hypothetical protein
MSEMKNEKWKGVVFCANHGVRLCTESSPRRELVQDPVLVKLDGSKVTDFSWTCPDEGSCWEKYHNFYLPRGLFNAKRIDLNDNKIKFGTPVYLSDLYQKKYEALGIEVKVKGNKKAGMGQLNFEQHVRRSRNL